MKKQNKETRMIRTHRVLNWSTTVILLLFAAWSVYINIQARSLFKQALTVSSEIENKIAVISQNVGTVTQLCNNVNSALSQLHEVATTTK